MTKLIFEKSVENTQGVKITDETVDFSFINSKFLNQNKKQYYPN